MTGPRALVQPLEQRRLLAVISGVIFGDTDSNELRGFFENGVPDVPVFLDNNQNGAFDEGEPRQLTDEQGRYKFTGLEAGAYYVGIELPEGFGQTSPGLSGRIPTGFDIDVVFPDNTLTPEQQDIFETAAQKWESVIVGDLPDVTLPDGTVIDDLQIRATGPSIDGPFNTLGQATFEQQRSLAEGSLPYTGFMEFDSADLTRLQSEGTLDEVILHEMGHVLGIGTLWFGGRAPEELVKGITGNAGDAPFYVGEGAIREYNRLFNNSASTVPIEPGGRPGSSYGHWAESVFGIELMSPNLGPGTYNPLSRLTAAGLEDIGYEINYLAVDEYRGIGALEEDLDTAFESIVRVPFEIGLTLRTGEDNFDQANFGIRLNQDPNPFFFNVGPVVQQVGQPVTLLAEIDNTGDPEFDGDADFRDEVVQVNFYRESNGTPGLQAGGLGGDELITEDVEGDDGFSATFDTTGIDLGEATFYARAYDELYFTQDRIVTLQVVDGQTLPAKPTDLEAVGTDETSILATWLDNSTDETGFLLEVSRSADFDIPTDIQRYYLPANEDTGPVSFDYTALDGVASTRYFRVRAFNTAGSTLFTNRTSARTLSAGEILVDNADADAVTVDGFDTITDPATAAVGISYLRGTSGFADFNPGLDESGEYFVFLRNVDLEQPGSVLVSVFGQDGNLIDEVTVDQEAAAGADVLVGTFDLAEGSFVRVAHSSGTATADAVRFLRTGA